jgi:hypothetical protein
MRVPNPDKARVGCLVPLCLEKWCSRKRKKLCALRRYFLEEQLENRRLLCEVKDPEIRKLIKERIYEQKEITKQKNTG